ncbi:MAG TPA: hypothetical protein VKA27_00150, partial [Sunxiuqinia sp.]|nr:hypothetical protein [Sunxiuqinia sp.]
ITANVEKCRLQVLNSTSVITALIPVLGYEKCSKIAQQAQQQKQSIQSIVLEQNLMNKKEFEHLISPEAVNKLGF